MPGYSLERYNVWRSRVSRHGLLTPEPLGSVINGPGHELYPLLVADGSLYFSAEREDSIGGRDSYRAQFKGGEFGQSENLGPGINGSTGEGDIYVSPDESCIIHVSSDRPGGFGGADLYISFRKADGSWSRGINMGDDIMWVDAAIIDTYRDQVRNEKNGLPRGCVAGRLDCSQTTLIRRNDIDLAQVHIPDRLLDLLEVADDQPDHGLRVNRVLGSLLEITHLE